jgi:hypothetical protein
METNKNANQTTQSIEITAAFTDSIFLEKVYAAIGKTAPEPIYASLLICIWQ